MHNDLRNARLSRGWTIAKLSSLTGIAASDLSNLENGHRPLYPRWRDRIARALRINPHDLEGANEKIDAEIDLGI
jgi:transcriptional regulator with XRE-family HTH domain